ncbi:MAG: PhoPQ-activated protein PqaA family protein, partial [Candidatus Krumholzibacteria bacterium]|nr:PhoPQ-activated protein PqaA family protein [Candidatus Krumholzibacteria bacterium]
GATALDDFVYAPDPDFQWWIEEEIQEDGYRIARMKMISGQWRVASELDETHWVHDINVYVPDVILQDTGLLIVAGGSSSSDPADPDADMISGLMASSTGSVVAGIMQVPYQPITFADEDFERYEDALIAYSWAKFLSDSSDVTWPAQLPMTRAAVRAMDAVQEYVSNLSPATPLENFCVAGGSKRGWTTWLTAAVESGPQGQGRVSAIIPIVIDCLNVQESFEHHFDVYGFWAPAVHDYVEAGVMDYLDTPEGDALFHLVDPFVYRDRCTMNKIIFNSTGDQFFLPDSWQFYYEDLPGPKYLRYVPNTDHSMSQLSVDVVAEVLGLYVTLLADEPFPDYSWSISDERRIRLETSEPGVQVRLWEAVNPQNRDFRYDVIGPAYMDSPVTDQGGGIFEVLVDRPTEGWKAFFLEAEFSGTMTLSTGVYVIGDGTSSGSGDFPLQAVALEAWPNPFNPRVRLHFELKSRDFVSLRIHDSRGRLLSVLAEGELASGPHDRDWNGHDAAGRGLPSGVYLAILSTSSGVDTHKLLLLR